MMEILTNIKIGLDILQRQRHRYPSSSADGWGNVPPVNHKGFKVKKVLIATFITLGRQIAQ